MTRTSWLSKRQTAPLSITALSLVSIWMLYAETGALLMPSLLFGGIIAAAWFSPGPPPGDLWGYFAFRRARRRGTATAQQEDLYVDD